MSSSGDHPLADGCDEAAVEPSPQIDHAPSAGKVASSSTNKWLSSINRAKSKFGEWVACGGRGVVGRLGGSQKLGPPAEAFKVSGTRACATVGCA